MLAPEYEKLYAKFATACFVSFFLGCQCVHYYYKQLTDFEELVKEKMKIIEIRSMRN